MDALIAGEIRRNRLCADVFHFGEIGKRLLVQAEPPIVVGEIQRTVRRPADFVARYGGEEFVLILPETDAEGVEEMAIVLLHSVESQLLVHAPNAMRQHVTVSIGCSVWDPAHTDTAGLEARTLIKCSDEALYQSKKEGRNRSTRAD